MYAKLIIVGNLGGDPEMRYTPDGTPVTTFSVEEVPDDPSDTKYLACALEGSAQYIGTGDQNPLRLDPWRGIRIVPPADLLETEFNLQN
jgi:predicted nucleic acid-binding protein